MADKLVTIGSDVRGKWEVAYAQGYRHPTLGLRPITPLPKPGDLVLYRSNEWFDPIVATVELVDIEPGHPSMGLPTPWPKLLLLVTPAPPKGKLDVSGHLLAKSAGPRPYHMRTMEARMIGSAGWLPLDWEMLTFAPQGV
jgi:hypothetical protein